MLPAVQTLCKPCHLVLCLPSKDIVKALTENKGRDSARAQKVQTPGGEEDEKHKKETNNL